jgi:hypothetical protein
MNPSKDDISISIKSDILKHDLSKEIASKSTIRKNKSFVLEDVDVDKYMTFVEQELKEIGFALNDRAFIAKIITILDRLIEPHKFNKTIFFHILGFANLDRDSPIMLLDFFRSFFSVYESMKKNRDKLGNEITTIQNRIDSLVGKRNRCQIDEKILADGLTTNSQIKIRVSVKGIGQEVNLSSAALSIRFKLDNIVNDLDLATLNRKAVLPLTSIKLAEAPIRVLLLYEGVEVPIDIIKVKEILDNPLVKKYNYNFFNYEITYVWINSKVNHYIKEISNLEAQNNENKESVDILNSSINHIEGK